MPQHPKKGYSYFAKDNNKLQILHACDQFPKNKREGKLRAIDQNNTTVIHNLFRNGWLSNVNHLACAALKGINGMLLNHRWLSKLKG